MLFTVCTIGVCVWTCSNFKHVKYGLIYVPSYMNINFSYSLFYLIKHTNYQLEMTILLKRLNIYFLFYKKNPL